MDTQTTVLTAFLTSLIVLASPSPQPDIKQTEARQAMAQIEDSATRVLRIMERSEHVRPEAAGPFKD